MALRVLGIDTALRTTGVGAVEAVGSRVRLIGFRLIRTRAGQPLSACLLNLDGGLADAIREWQPTVAAIEGAFFARNARTAMTLGQARGVAIAACARAGLAVYEYAPRRVKQAVVGFGAASKPQVQKMIMTLLGLEQPPPEDAGDALAVAICHLHVHGRPGLPVADPL